MADEGGMNVKSIEEYKQEMLSLYRTANTTPAPPPQMPQVTPEQTPQPTIPDEKGGLLVFVTTLRNLYGVQNARVSVLNERNEEIDSDITDMSGRTKVFILPTVPKNFSEDPTGANRPYSLYNVKITADGYEDRNFFNLPVFPTITSILPVDMILNSAFNENGEVG